MTMDIDLNAQTVKVAISERELSTIIAALALWKFFRAQNADDPNEYVELASNGGITTPLDDDEIDRLIYGLAEGPK